MHDFGRVKDPVHGIFVPIKVFALCRQHHVDQLDLAEYFR